MLATGMERPECKEFLPVPLSIWALAPISRYKYNLFTYLWESVILTVNPFKLFGGA